MPTKAESRKYVKSLIKGLNKQGRSKYWIAKSLGKPWRTIHNWDKGFCIPQDEHLNELETLFQNVNQGKV